MEKESFEILCELEKIFLEKGYSFSESNANNKNCYSFEVNGVLFILEERYPEIITGSLINSYNRENLPILQLRKDSDRRATFDELYERIDTIPKINNFNESVQFFFNMIENSIINK